MKLHTKALLLVLTLAMLLTVVTGCSGKSAGEETIKLGTLSILEPFIVELKDELVKKGYEVEVVMFDANNMPAIATKDGSIDGYIHNHLPWIQTFNQENNSDLRMVEPYLAYYRSALYSKKHTSIDSLPQNAQIAIPNDPANIEQSLELLEEVGLITLGEKTDAFYTILDIASNPKNITLLETEISTTARSVDDADAVICPAIRIQAAGMDANDFLAEDSSTVDFPIGLTVAPESLDEQWVKDAMDILQSDEMRAKFDDIFGGALVLYEKK